MPGLGPAGRVLDEALERVGLDRAAAYVTNVVKHFKWVASAPLPGREPRGKRRLHARPNQAEITACRPWLDLELTFVQPEVLVCLGATAAQALLGREFRVTRMRGIFVPSPFAPRVLATIHPSAILRADERRHEEMEALVADLRVVADALRQPALLHT